MGTSPKWLLVNKEDAGYVTPFLLTPRLSSSSDTLSIELWNLVWRFAIGGCRLDCPTKDLLLQNGDWEVLELETSGETRSLRPRVWGRLRKVACARKELRRDSRGLVSRLTLCKHWPNMILYFIQDTSDSMGRYIRQSLKMQPVLGTGYENTRRTRGNDEPGTAPYKSVGYFTRPIVFLRYPGFTRTRIPFLVA